MYFTSELVRNIGKFYCIIAIALAYIYKVNKEGIIEPDIELPNELIFNEDGTTNESSNIKKLSDYIMNFAFLYSSFLCFTTAIEKWDTQKFLAIIIFMWFIFFSCFSPIR